MNSFISVLISVTIIPIIMLTFGVIWKEHPPKNINWIYGYRSFMSMKNDETEVRQLNKEKSKKVVIIFTIISIVSMYLSYKSRGNEASSVGIIGGADGPTAIYLTYKLSAHFLTRVFGLFSIAGMAYLFFTKRAKK